MKNNGEILWGSLNSENIVKLTEKNKFATHLLQRCLEMCENKQKPSVSEDLRKKVPPVTWPSRAAGQLKTTGQKVDLRFADTQFNWIEKFVEWSIRCRLCLKKLQVQSRQLQSSGCGKD